MFLGPTPVYQFRVGLAGSALNVVQDFDTNNSFTWDPLQEGTCDIEVITKSSILAATSSQSATQSYTAKTRITGTSAVVAATANPLVALRIAAASLDRCQFDDCPVQPAKLKPYLDQYRPSADRAW